MVDHLKGGSQVYNFLSAVQEDMNRVGRFRSLELQRAGLLGWLRFAPRLPCGTRKYALTLSVIVMACEFSCIVRQGPRVHAPLPYVCQHLADERVLPVSEDPIAECDSLRVE
jgi:hypothetical protein